MRICLIYDCLFPWTIGGAERWYRNLAERLAGDGHQVSYLTLRQWDEEPRIPGVEVIAVGPRMALYSKGKRRLLPPLRFGLGVLLHLLAKGHRYDVVHTASFPYFSLLAAGMARPFGGYRILCDWHEVWSREYWADYLGRLGPVGAFVQALCARVPQRAFAFSRLHQKRMQRLGLTSITRLTGLYAPLTQNIDQQEIAVPPTVVYAGRFIQEKRVELLVEALAIARAQMPELRASLIGDGPTRTDLITRIEALGMSDAVACPGFVTSDELDATMTSALCLVQPSSREGYGLVVIEAAHRGVPIVVVEAPDNAATELVSEGRNGLVVKAADAAQLASAILECARRGTELRRSTRQWYSENQDRVAIEASLEVVVREYHGGPATETAKSSGDAECRI